MSVPRETLERNEQCQRETDRVRSYMFGRRNWRRTFLRWLGVL